MRQVRLLIIGAGPGGYVAAIRAGQLGIDTTLVDAQAPGGTCLNVGCIPSKALIEAANQYHHLRQLTQASPVGLSVQEAKIDIARTVAWKDGIVTRLTGGVRALLKKNGVGLVQGHAEIIDGKTVDVRLSDSSTQRYRCEHLIIATGSAPTQLPGLPWGERIVDSTHALSPSTIPGRMAIVGGGYIGLELGFVYAKLGSQVTIIEAEDRILPGYDAAMVRPVQQSLKSLGVNVLVHHRVEAWDDTAAQLKLIDTEGKRVPLPVDSVLVAAGRRPRLEGYGVERLGLEMQNGAIRIDETCRTSMRNVWAIGDVTGEPMLAHRAMAQGSLVAELIGGARRRFTPAVIPAVCFTDPELVVAGLTPSQAKHEGLECVDAIFPLAANGRALTLGAGDGFIRVVARRDNHLIVGWQAVGQHVSELATAFGQSIEMAARLEDIGGTIHAHPTLGEAMQEAALRALGEAIHV